MEGTVSPSRSHLYTHYVKFRNSETSEKNLINYL